MPTYRDYFSEIKKRVKEATPQQVADLLGSGDIQLADVREKNEWDEGHLPNAVHLPKSYVEQWAEDRIPDKDKTTVLYCAARCSLSHGRRHAGEARLRQRDLHERRVQPLEGLRSSLEEARRRSHAGTGSALQPSPPHPRGRRGGSARSSFAARCCSSAPAASVRPPRSTWPPRASARSASSTRDVVDRDQSPAPDPPHDRAHR